MKRFLIALLFLALIVAFAVMFNIKMLHSADELISLIESDSSSDEIQKNWEKERLIFITLLSNDKTQEIDKIINNLDAQDEEAKSELKSKLNLLKESLELSFENVF